MKKIKILDKGFPTTDYGYLSAGSENDLPDHFADYCVLKMKSAVYCEVKKPVQKAVKK